MSRFVAPTLVLCFLPITKDSAFEKYNVTEDNIIDQYFPESVKSLTWEQFENDIYYQYGKDFTISITMKKDKTKKDDTASMTSNIIDLKEGPNTGNDKNKINLNLEKLKTLESGLCYKMISDMETFDKIKHFSIEMKDHFKDVYVESKFDQY